MILHIVAVRDIKADCFGQPNFVPNTGASIRSFGDQCQDEKSGVLYQHPEDFELYKLGTYNDQDGSFDTIKPVQLAVGSNYQR